MIELIVPLRLAQDLEREGAEAEADEPAAPVARIPAQATPRVEPRSEFHVALPSADVRRRPPEPGTIAIWDWDMACELVERHNAGFGSPDSADRRRMTAILREMVSQGPWKLMANPAAIAPEGLMAQVRNELGHLPELVDAIGSAVARGASTAQPFRLGPLLLVGPPGCGKSYAALRLSELLGLHARAIDMAAQQTNSFLHGGDRHWGNAVPGALFEMLVLGPCANPLIVLDELDKISKGSQYDPSMPLHSALEPSTSKVTRDLCTHAVFDASQVSYVATANSLEDIPSPLLSRFEVIPCVPPGPRELLHLARSVWAQVSAAFGVQGTLPRGVLVRLAEHPPRRMRQLLERALGRMRLAGRAQIELRDLDASCRQSSLH